MSHLESNSDRDYVTIEAKVSRAFTTSMEVFIDVWIDDDKGKKIKQMRQFIHLCCR